MVIRNLTLVIVTIPKQAKSIPIHEFNFYIIIFTATLYYCLNVPSIIIETCNIFAWLKFRNIARSCTKTRIRKYFIWWNPSHFNARRESWSKAVVWSCSIDSISKTITVIKIISNRIFTYCLWGNLKKGYSFYIFCSLFLQLLWCQNKVIMVSV